ncbi:MAG: hypothetical protein IKN74_01335 [Clostridia bacterium]|nr:hypothetical protein [Clostridia bacterium]
MKERDDSNYFDSKEDAAKKFFKENNLDDELSRIVSTKEVIKMKKERLSAISKSTIIIISKTIKGPREFLEATQMYFKLYTPDSFDENLSSYLKLCFSDHALKLLSSKELKKDINLKEELHDYFSIVFLKLSIEFVGDLMFISLIKFMIEMSWVKDEHVEFLKKLIKRFNIKHEL